VLDRDFGPGFIKLCSYFPYPAKVWVNGHEWAKRQATSAGLAFTELANGFASCDDPERLQAICDRLGPADIQRFFDRWLAHIPTPLGLADQAAGYWWELSMRQIEVSRTLVPDQPRRARAFFEALVQDNLDVGRPDEVKLIFARRIRKDTPGNFATRIVTRGVEVAVNVFYRHSRIKQYLKEGRALRIETVVNSPTDLVGMSTWSGPTSLARSGPTPRSCVRATPCRHGHVVWPTGVGPSEQSVVARRLPSWPSGSRAAGRTGCRSR
jgi:hypothetical protein